MTRVILGRLSILLGGRNDDVRRLECLKVEKVKRLVS